MGRHKKKYESVFPAKPDGLSDVASAKWDTLRDELTDLENYPITLIDADGLRAYCEAWDLYLAALVEIKQRGRNRDSLKARREALNDIQYYSRKFAMSPADRKGLFIQSVLDNQTNSVGDDFLSDEIEAAIVKFG